MANRTETFYSSETLAKYGMNAQLLVGNGASPEVFEAIAGIRAITPGSIDTEDIDLTHLRSPDSHKEHGPGYLDSGPFEFNGIWMPEEESQSYTGGGSGSFVNGGLIAMQAARTIHNFVIRFADGGSPVGFEWPFRGYLSKFQPGEIVGDNIVEFSAALQPARSYIATLP